jgi:hypothetical protein
MYFRADDFGNGYDAYVSALALTSDGRLLSFFIDNWRANDWASPAEQVQTDRLHVTLGASSQAAIQQRCPVAQIDLADEIGEGAFTVHLI